ncbi:protein regulator of cytokinesis 1-like [Atheta coriaria]|uniref:protein regulator of cytokinesis 1-like n=1 Tax=Dalotia coriaria TaxID=877792 RepID=UPI0031F44D3B
MRENMDIDGSLSICEDTRVKRILQSVETGLRSWYSIVNTFGLNENDKVKWEEELQDEIEACVNDCHAAAIEKQQALIDKIESLLTESEKMCKKLTIQMPSFAPTNQGLYNDEKYLIELVKGWQEEITTRTVEIDNLKTRRDEVSKSLGREPFFVKESPLPSRDEIEMYKIKLQELEVEKQHRIEKFRDLQERIIALSDEIKFMPKLDFERDIITGDNLLFFEASDENMQRVEQFHFDLLEMREKIEQELNKLREALEHLWKVLEEDVKYCNDFIQTHVGLNYKTLEAFKTEVKRCELIRKTNLGKFIVKLRTELIDRWNEAGFSEARRAEFAIYMEDDMFTEDLLTLHDMQIERVKAYLRNNQEIFELLKQRDVLYKRMRDLDERANAPDRFKNRGGQLLKEEKERKAVTKKIPCIEEQLLNLAVQYEEKHGEKFTYFDDTIESLIERSREVLEQEKKEQMSAKETKT